MQVLFLDICFAVNADGGNIVYIEQELLPFRLVKV
jgi:hypothetical protein